MGNGAYALCTHRSRKHCTASWNFTSEARYRLTLLGSPHCAPSSPSWYCVSPTTPKEKSKLESDLGEEDSILAAVTVKEDIAVLIE